MPPDFAGSREPQLASAPSRPLDGPFTRATSGLVSDVVVGGAENKQQVGKLISYLLGSPPVRSRGPKSRFISGREATSGRGWAGGEKKSNLGLDLASDLLEMFFTISLASQPAGRPAEVVGRRI